MTTKPAAGPSAPPFRCVVSSGDGRDAEAALHGDLDLANAPLLRTELLTTLDTGIDHLVIDLGNLTFLDSSGIGVLVTARKRATELGADLELRAVPPHARQVLEKCGLANLFGLSADES